MSNILRKMQGALAKKRHTVTINDAEYHFYPVRMRRLLSGDLQQILVPIYEAIQVLFRSPKADQEVLEEVTPDGVIARAIKPATEGMVQLRAQQRDKAMHNSMEILFNSDTRYNVALLILDSLRDEFPDGKPKRSDAEEFVDSDDMDLPTFFEFFKGFMGANTAIFGDLGNLIRERVKQAVARMAAPEDPETQMDEDLDDEMDPTDSFQLE